MSEGNEELKAFLTRESGASSSKFPDCELVGRKREYELLIGFVEKQQFWHVDNPRGFVTHLVAGIEGEAGIGKTTILSKLEQELSDDSNLILLKGYSSDDNSVSGELWQRIIENLMGLEHAQGVTADVIISYFSESYGVTVSEEDADSLSLFLSSEASHESAEQYCDGVAAEIAFRNLFEALGEKLDPVFIFEDLHNCDENSLEILRFIIANTQRKRPYVFIVSFRPIKKGNELFLEIPSGYFDYELVRLTGLDANDQKRMCDLLLSSVLPGVCCSKEFLKCVSDRTGGNPLFIKELIGGLIQQNLLRSENGEWKLQGDVSAAGSSENIRLLYEARLKSLSYKDRVLLKCLSVLGEQFTLSTMYSYLEAVSFGPVSFCGNLAVSMKGFLKMEISAFRRSVSFSHSLLRQYLYDQLKEDQLKALHSAAAGTFENSAGSDPGTIALHYREAGETEKALNWAMKKLQFLLGMHDRRGTVAWSNEVLRWISGSEKYLEQEFQLRSNLYRSLSSIGSKQRAEHELELLEELVENSEVNRLKLEVRIMRFSYLVQTGSMNEAGEMLEKLEKDADALGDSSNLISFLDAASRFYQLDYKPEKAMEYVKRDLDEEPAVSYSIRLKKRKAALIGGMGDQKKAREILFEILETARGIHAPLLELGILNAIAQNYFDTGKWEKAQDFWNRGIKLARNTGSRSSEATMLNLLGHMYSKTKSIKEALEMQTMALTVMEETGNRHGVSKVLTDLGILYTRTGEKKQALDMFERSLLIAREMNNKGAAGAVLANLSSLQKDLGDYEDAEKNISEAISIWHETGYLKREASCISNRGSILEKMGRLDEAVDSFREAIRIGDLCDDRSGNSQRYGNLAVMMQIKHRWEEAETYYDKAIEMCSEIGNTRMEAVWIGFKGVFWDTTGKREKALDYYLKSMEMLKEVGDRQYLFLMMGNYAGLMAKMGNDDEAYRVNKEKLSICREKGYKVDEASALCAIGHHYRKRDDYETAFKYFKDACLIASEKKVAVHLFRGVMVLYRVLKERNFPVEELLPVHWGDPREILRDSHEPEKKGKNI